MPTREQTRDAWRIVHALAATEHLTIDDPAAGAHVCRFCGGEAGDDGMPVHALDCPYLAATHLLAQAGLGRGDGSYLYTGLFAPLIAQLAICPGDTIAFTLTEIEAIIGQRLPERASVESSSWVSGKVSMVRWAANGWRARLVVKARAVAFRRVADDT